MTSKNILQTSKHKVAEDDFQKDHDMDQGSDLISILCESIDIPCEVCVPDYKFPSKMEYER